MYANKMHSIPSLVRGAASTTYQSFWHRSPMHNASCRQTRDVCSRAPLVTAVQSKDTKRQPRPENVPGPFFVDATCIDCDTCRWVSPETFKRVNGKSAVVAQPSSKQSRRSALHAMAACPTFSIHATGAEPEEVVAAQTDFPLPTVCPDIYYLGFHSEHSFGASSWFVTREGGNVLFDSPRFHPRLAKRIKEMGGARYMVLSHRDDVCDHVKWAAALGCERIIHEKECNRQQATDECERKLTGEGPWQLADGSDDIDLIFTPGHTSGSISLLHSPSETMLTGDHLLWSHKLDRLSIAASHNWDSVPKQLESVKQMMRYPWLHIFPGHGRQRHFRDENERLVAINKLLVAEGATAMQS